MSEVDMLRAALGVLGAVISFMARVIYKLIQRSWEKDDKMIQFAKDLLARGDPFETVEKITRILQETKAAEYRSTMGRNDPETGTRDT